MKLKGYLYVIIAEAKDLPDIGQDEDALDSYCVVFVDGMEEGSTLPEFDTTQPAWNKKIKIKVNGEYEELSLQLFDASKDDENHLGQVLIDLKTVLDGETHDLWLDLKQRPESVLSDQIEKVQGKLHIA